MIVYSTGTVAQSTAAKFKIKRKKKIAGTRVLAGYMYTSTVREPVLVHECM